MSFSRTKKILAGLIAIGFLFSADESVFSASIGSFVHGVSESGITSQSWNDFEDGLDHLVCTDHAPWSPCKDSEPCQYHVALPSSVSVKFPDAKSGTASAFFVQDYGFTHNKEGDPNLLNIPPPSKSEYHRLVGIIKRLD